MADQHLDEDLLIALALSDLDEQVRGEVTRHIATCDRCRSEYASVADSVDRILAAAPSVAPPPGFSSAVLAAMGMGEADDGARVHPTSGSDARRSGNGDSGDDGVEGTASGAQRRLARSLGGASSAGGRRRRGLSFALVASIALLAGAVGAVAVLENRREPTTQVVAADGPALLTEDGSRVGTVLESRFEGAPVLVVTLTDGRVGVRYECQLVLADGTREPAGSWLVQVPAVTWVVSRPDGAADVAAVELVTPSGTVWATAAL